jgi:hypothetical protein
MGSMKLSVRMSNVRRVHNAMPRYRLSNIRNICASNKKARTGLHLAGGTTRSVAVEETLKCKSPAALLGQGFVAFLPETPRAPNREPAASCFDGNKLLAGIYC